MIASTNFRDVGRKAVKKRLNRGKPRVLLSADEQPRTQSLITAPHPSRRLQQEQRRQAWGQAHSGKYTHASLSRLLGQAKNCLRGREAIVDVEAIHTRLKT